MLRPDLFWYDWTLLLIVVFQILSIDGVPKQLSTDIPRLLIISLDGFRHQYFNAHTLPALSQFRNEGVYATEGMLPTFTTMTYPNHISIVTGMYQDQHGIIQNMFYDRLLNKTISMGSRDEGQWSDPKVEPIWITATKQAKKSAVLFWPACHNEFNGTRPLIYSWSYTDAVPFREKINNAVSYFRELPVQLVLLYHEEVDKQGHASGPDSMEVRETLTRVDNDVAYLLKKVKNELNDNLNIIFVSDHGMSNVKQIIQPFVEQYIDRSMVEKHIIVGGQFSVIPREGQSQKVIDGLRRIPNVTVYKRSELPERFHYSKPDHRLGEIFVIPNEGVMFLNATTNASYSKKGHHGWDNTLLSMQAIFLARGPSFNENIQIRSINTVDIYHIACHILELIPNPYANVGSLKNLTRIFRSKTYHSSTISNNKCSSVFTEIWPLPIFLFAFIFFDLFFKY